MVKVSPRGGAGEVILQVDDFAPQRHVRHRILADAGFAVRDAGSLAEAREVLRAEPISLLLLDVGLPDGDGLAFCAEVKHAHHSLPVVMVTESNRGQHVRRDAIDAGADAFLAEPVPRDQLIRVVRQMIDEAAAKGRGVGAVRPGDTPRSA